MPYLQASNTVASGQRQRCISHERALSAVSFGSQSRRLLSRWVAAHANSCGVTEPAHELRAPEGLLRRACGTAAAPMRKPVCGR
jgi:hypothetical protein